MFESYKFLTMQPKVLVSACSDDRFPFTGFLKHNLGLDEGYYFPIRVPGGLAPLAYREILPAHFEVAVSYLKIALKHRPAITTLVNFGHDNGCAFYEDFLPEFKNRVREDLPTVAEIVKDLFPQIKHVKLFHASVTTGDMVEFHPVSEAMLQTA